MRKHLEFIPKTVEELQNYAKNQLKSRSNKDNPVESWDFNMFFFDYEVER